LTDTHRAETTPSKFPFALLGGVWDPSSDPRDRVSFSSRPLPPRRWLYQFAAENNPNDSQKFIKSLFAVRPDYGQRILTQRQSLLARWRKTFDGSAVAESIEKQNLEHLRDQLFATVNLSEESLSMEDESECLTEEEKAANCVQESEGEIA
jgi:hypothetical protein